MLNRWMVIAATAISLLVGQASLAQWSAPSPISPMGLTPDSTPEYRWSVVAGATWYQLWVNDSTGTVVNRWYTAAQVGAWSGECSITPAEALATGSATWWVRAWNESKGSGPWSIGATFSIGLGLVAPTLIAPSGETFDSTPEYRWSVVAGATWYQLWVNDSTGTVINRWYTAGAVASANGECATTPAESIAIGSATWWVRAWNPSQGNGPWSPGMDFSVGSTLPAPSPLGPIGLVQGSTPTYRWAPVSGATWYQLWVNDSAGTVINRWYTAAQVDAQSGECSVTPQDSLQWGHARWWVRAWSPAAGAGSWSDTVSFRVFAGPGSWAAIVELDPDPGLVTNEAVRAAIVATGFAWRVIDVLSGVEMLLVPPGSFAMGCSPSLDSDCYAEEHPVHQVQITQPFYLGQYEISQGQWEDVMDYNPSAFAFAKNYRTLPVDSVTWFEVEQFMQTTGLRLPTEAEWEFACRAGTNTAFNNGSDADGTLNMIAWYDGNAAVQTFPVGDLRPNEWGFHDMHGNVFEWVGDWYGINYYSQSPAADPLGPDSGSSKVIRGGGWFSFSRECRSSYRSSRNPVFAVHDYIGFRAARSP